MTPENEYYFPIGKVEAWLRKFFRAKQEGKEFIFSCPKCGHDRLYFNSRKQVGHCKRGSCHWTPGIQQLIGICGVSPNEMTVSGYEIEDRDPVKNKVFCSLPEGCKPLVTRENGKLMSQFPDIVRRIRADRGITVADMRRWGLQVDCESDRIVIPVYSGGICRTYVSRAVWWFKGKTDYKRYDYPKGCSVRNWLFGWEELGEKTNITLVENTFNAIWLRENFNCTTNFGSSLSKAQIDLIFKSKVTRVNFVWDYGTKGEAQKASRALNAKGIATAIYDLPKEKPQPDDWTMEELASHVGMILPDWYG